MPEPSVPFPPLDVIHVRRALEDSPFADVRYTALTASTNDDAAALLADPQASGATIVAEEQSAGKGRRAGRAWIAMRGSALLFTTILPRRIAASDLWAVPFWVALGVADGINQACGVHLDLRWPNDGFVAGRKVAGILCVSRVMGDAAYVGCGVGINVLRPNDASIATIEPPPAFLSDVAPHARREVVLTEVLRAFERRLSSLHSPDVVARTYEERSAMAGTSYRVRLDSDGTEIDGIARGLGANGALRLESGGVEHAIALADARRL